ncbi:hypothetical protein FHS72_002853 [Loktanella ponticola]|uniref:Uncharacterized protein n=1 Tax=Yoonia ponticola TaxID=1524255 RepID=A0A7W9BMI3_9RHOB|nr:hypothetical protein [Yoonia ponticola]MBB5723216.1 hypothetical protein [Yoonia ponticola]
MLQLLEEHLNEKGIRAISLKDLQGLFVDDLKIGVNRIRHLMPELGWSAVSVKWGGVDHSRAVWLRPDHQLSNGEIFGPGGFRAKFDGKTSEGIEQPFDLIDAKEVTY